MDTGLREWWRILEANENRRSTKGKKKGERQFEGAAQTWDAENAWEALRSASNNENNRYFSVAKAARTYKSCRIVVG